MKKLNIKRRKDLTMLYMKSVLMSLADLFEKFPGRAVYEKGVIAMCNFSLPTYTWQCSLKKTVSKKYKVFKINIYS